MDIEAFITPLVRILGQAAIVVYAYSLVIRVIDKGPLKALAVGLLFGIGGILSMSDPIHWMPGVIHDGRSVLLVLAPIYAGPLGTVIAAAMMVGYRLLLGGAGAFGGAVGVVLVAATGYALTRLPAPWIGKGHRRAVIFGIATTTSLAVLFFLPSDVATKLLHDAVVPVMAANIIGVFLLCDLLDRERYRIRIQRALENEASVDPLTKLPNRRVLQRAGDRCASDLENKQIPFAMIMLDIDHFKKINDTWGHSVGDTVLSKVADVIRSTVRKTDVAARYGGEEIAVLLPQTEDWQAQIVAEKIRSRIEAQSLSLDRGEVRVTVSIGIASSTGHAWEFHSVLDAADKALYEAKASGRNRVAMAAAA